MNGKVKEEQVLYDAKGKMTHIVMTIRRYHEILSCLDDALDLSAMKIVEREKSLSWRDAKKKILKKNK